MRQFIRAATAAFAILIGAFSSAALADDWTAVKLRGTVLQLVGDEWVKLKRGDVVSDDRVIRTMGGGNVQFQRAAETIDLGPQTQIQIFDRVGKRFTTVKQYFGTVAVEAEVQNVLHFAVQTPHLAAVVKGTRFVVVSGKDSAKVKVTRGHVAVEGNDSHQTVTVAAGQSVTAEEGESLEVAGKGNLPVVLNADGTPVVKIELADEDSGKDKGKKDKSDDGVSVDANGVSVNASVGGLNVSVNAGNSGNGNGNGNGNSGSGNNGNGGGNGNGNSGNGNGNGGGVVSGAVGTVGGLVGGLL